MVHKVMEGEAVVSRLYNLLDNLYARALSSSLNVNPDLDDYVTRKALSGLFLLLFQDERRIRENPAARTTEIIKKVFGAL